MFPAFLRNEKYLHIENIFFYCFTFLCLIVLEVETFLHNNRFVFIFNCVHNMHFRQIRCKTNIECSLLKKIFLI